MKTELRVRTYTDYRAFLNAHIQDMKSLRADWSYGMWAQRLGLKDTSSITKIINGDREPGESITEKMVTYFGFNEDDAVYFKDLVQLSKIRHDPRMSAMLLEKMGKESPSTTERVLDEQTFASVANWFYFPLREMTRMANFKEDPQWISEHMNFAVTPEEITVALKTMMELDLLRRNDQGRLEIAEGRVLSTNEISSEAIRQSHEQSLQNAKTAVRTVPVPQREFQAESLVINTKNLEQAKQMITEFREKFSQVFEESSGDEVYQIQIQFYPVTKSLNGSVQ